MREQTPDLARPPQLVTAADRQEHRRQQHRLVIAEADERAMAEWRQHHPEDVANKNAFWERRARRHAERADMHRWKALVISQCDLGHASFFSEDDDWWADAFVDMSDDTSEEEEDDNSE